MTPNHQRPDYRPPEPPTGWHDQDWLLILTALDQYARDGPDDVTEGQELRAYQLVESIAHLHGTVSLGSVRFLDNSYFDQYARRANSEQEGDVVNRSVQAEEADHPILCYRDHSYVIESLSSGLSAL